MKPEPTNLTEVALKLRHSRATEQERLTRLARGRLSRTASLSRPSARQNDISNHLDKGFVLRISSDRLAPELASGRQSLSGLKASKQITTIPPDVLSITHTVQVQSTSRLKVPLVNTCTQNIYTHLVIHYY